MLLVPGHCSPEVHLDELFSQILPKADNVGPIHVSVPQQTISLHDQLTQAEGVAYIINTGAPNRGAGDDHHILADVEDREKLYLITILQGKVTITVENVIQINIQQNPVHPHFCPLFERHDSVHLGTVKIGSGFQTTGNSDQLFQRLPFFKLIDRLPLDLSLDRDSLAPGRDEDNVVKLQADIVGGLTGKKVIVQINAHYLFAASDQSYIP